MDFLGFKDFVVLVEELNTQTGYEHAITSAWNHFIKDRVVKSGKKTVVESGHLKRLADKKNYGNKEHAEKTREEMHQEIEKAKEDENHPLNIKNASHAIFKGGKKDIKKDKQAYYEEMHRAVDSVHGMVAHSKHLHEAVEKGHVLASLGQTKSKLSSIWKKHGAKDSTSKSDIALVDKKHIDENGHLKHDAKGAGISISLKKGSGAQLGASSINEISAMHEHAFDEMMKHDSEYIKMSEKKKAEHKKELLEKLEEAKQKARELSNMPYLEKDSKEKSTPKRKKIIDEVNGHFESKRNEIAKIFDEIHKKHPKLKHHVIMEAVTGKGKFKTDTGEDSVSSAKYIMETPTFDAHNRMIHHTEIHDTSHLTPAEDSRLEVSHKTDSYSDNKKGTEEATYTHPKSGEKFEKRKTRADTSTAVIRIRPGKGGSYFKKAIEHVKSKITPKKK